jgi:hypothetical protein
VLSAVEVSRLLEGVAAALRTHVAPHVDDRFAQMQLRAIDELLRNLAGRVEWSLPELEAELDELEGLLAELRAAGWTEEAAGDDHHRPAGSVPGALAHRAALLARLTAAAAWAQQSDSDAARALVTARLRSANDRERGRLQSGMYG